jgi:HEAT repeat protein
MTNRETKQGGAPARLLAWLLSGLLFLLCLGAVFALMHAPRETFWGGRRLTEWLAGVSGPSASGRGAGSHPAATTAALEEMAPDCLPYMLAMMRANDKRWQQRLAALLAKQDLIKIRLKPRPSYTTRWEAARGFALLGTNAQPAVPKLARLLRDPDTAGQAAFALAFIGTEEATQALEQALLVKDPVVRQTVISWLHTVGEHGHRLVPGCILRLQDSDPWVRVYAARALGAFHSLPHLAVPALSARLKDQNTDVRREAAAALAAWGCPARSAIPALQAALREQDATYEAAVRRALQSIADCEGQ